jgi:HD-GYP domain-containing protein (c-di-GMP phosphodiesterase class II)
LKGDAIPILAKIVAVADTYDAMTTNRSYRQALTRKAAIQELRRCSGSQFDKRVVEAFMQALREGEI